MASLRSENSTNVRYDDGAAKAALEVATAEEAVRRFLTPPRHPRPAAEQQLLDQADTWTILAAGSTVQAWSWGAGPIALLVHGWGGRGSQLMSLVQPLLEMGRQVVTFDAPAHGDSSGSRTTVAGMARTIAAVVESNGGSVESVISHSFGGAATTVALARGLVAKRVAYVAPLFSLERSVDRYLDFIGLPEVLRAQFRDLLSEANAARVEELDGPVLAPRMQAELLVVHDSEDREVPDVDGAEVASTWPGARLVTTTGLGHRRILSDRDVVETVAAFATGTRAPRLLLDEWSRIELDLADREGRRSRAFP